MVKTEPIRPDPSLDFALLQQTPPRLGGRHRRALWWLLGLLALLVGSVLSVVLYLNNFEVEEEARRRAADTQWLEQSVQFHFGRLEDDLLMLARQAALGAGQSAGKSTQGTPLQGGLLWREPGVVLTHGWRAAAPDTGHWVGPDRWLRDWAAHPINAQALGTLQDTTRGLRRPAYAGLMQHADGSLTHVVWLAVPFFDRGLFAGNYLAALSLDRAVTALVPAWFQHNHSVQLVADEMPTRPPGGSDAPALNTYRASLSLPGTDLFLDVAPLGDQPTTVPRIFFLVALLFLLGMLISLYALRRDFVKRQQVQALLQAEVAVRTAMQNSVTIGLRAWDNAGKILYVNEAFCRMVGYPASVLVGQSAPLPYWPADPSDALYLAHRTVLAQGTLDDGVEVQFQHQAGHRVDVLIHESPLNAANGVQLGWMSSVLDISERKKAQRMAALQQERLEASGRLVAVGEVASTLAHELNQPLGALSSFANGLLNRLNGDNITLTELRPVVARMARLAERAGGIIWRINAFARRREISRQRVDLTVVLRRAFASVTNPQGSRITLPLEKGPIWVHADELLLEHLLNNLAANALDWAHRGAGRAQVRVEVTSDLVQRMACLVVADSGPGVDPQNQANIFNAFFSSKDGGMGMGLAICRSIVEAHHGRIDVDSDPDLGGARFTVWLALADSQTPEATANPVPNAYLETKDSHEPSRHSHR